MRRFLNARGVSEHLPNARRVADRFHVVQLATRQLDKVRAAEAKESKEKRALLARTKYIWLKNEANLAERQAERKRSLAKEHLKTVIYLKLGKLHFPQLAARATH